MIDSLVSTLLFTIQMFAVGGVYGLVIGIFWTPFLLSARLRGLFATLPPSDWRVSYALWIPLPAVVWGFLFVNVLSISPDIREPTSASPLYVGGVDGIVVATLVSLVLWPVVLLYVLPTRGYDWDPEEYSMTTVVLVVGGLLWYFLFLVGPAYVLSIFAGFGDAMTGP
jgi:hypothetical protein